MNSVLVVDDEPAICHCFQELLSELDCSATIAASAEEGLRLARQNDFDVVVLDIRLPKMDGLTAMSEFREISSAPVVVMTAHGSLSTAVTAVQEGAFDYLPKPFDLDQVVLVLKRALAESAAQLEPNHCPGGSPAAAEELIGDSLPMQQLFRQIAMAAQHDAPVLITGESGVGKELVARALHKHSQRKNEPLVAVHLASLSGALLERELFGHTAGAFTGADKPQAGVIAEANGGTLFLDEIGEAPKSVQVKLLRTMESGEFYPVGSSSPLKSDFRLVAATNVPIDILRSTEHFRPDLYYRLAAIQIRVPPLRERIDDVPLLADRFLQQYSPGTNRKFTNSALNRLQRKRYPGNVRELRNTVIRAATASNEIVIDATAIEESVPHSEVDAACEVEELRRAAQKWARQAMSSETPGTLLKVSEIIETEVIAAAMKQTGGNRSAAAQLLGIHRETLREKLSKYDNPDGNSRNATT
ncbi:MAG: sigma-54 dependent transcriptional regulator [Planctomycetaceae bacterium]